MVVILSFYTMRVVYSLSSSLGSLASEDDSLYKVIVYAYDRCNILDKIVYIDVSQYA